MFLEMKFSMLILGRYVQPFWHVILPMGEQYDLDCTMKSAGACRDPAHPRRKSPPDSTKLFD